MPQAEDFEPELGEEADEDFFDTDEDHDEDCDCELCIDEYEL